LNSHAKRNVDAARADELLYFKKYENPTGLVILSLIPCVASWNRPGALRRDRTNPARSPFSDLNERSDGGISTAD
jgi:hypothetical protein